jgi:hypothetical protein
MNTRGFPTCLRMRYRFNEVWVCMNFSKNMEPKPSANKRCTSSACQRVIYVQNAVTRRETNLRAVVPQMPPSEFSDSWHYLSRYKNAIEKMVSGNLIYLLAQRKRVPLRCNCRVRIEWTATWLGNPSTD